MNFTAILLSVFLVNAWSVTAHPDEVSLSIRRPEVTSPEVTSPEAIRGKAGPKGEKGEKGSCSCDVTEVEEMRSELDSVKERMRRLESHRHHDDEPEPMCLAGMKDGRVNDDDITANDYWHRAPDMDSTAHAPYHARLDSTGQSWAAQEGSGYTERDHWLQVDFKTAIVVRGVVTQGRHQTRHQQWVTSYKISYGDDGLSWTTVQENGGDKVFQGNRDSNSHVINMFARPIRARYVRLITESCHGNCLLRMDYLTGC